MDYDSQGPKGLVTRGPEGVTICRSAKCRKANLSRSWEWRSTYTHQRSGVFHTAGISRKRGMYWRMMRGVVYELIAVVSQILHVRLLRDRTTTSLPLFGETLTSTQLRTKCTKYTLVEETGT
jgi:hypothetical protein